MKLNQFIFKEGCSHYVYINELSHELRHSEIIGLYDFYQINIPVQKQFYLEFKSSPSKEVIMLFELDKNSIINFEKYFKHSISLTYQSEIIIENKNILLCKLDDIACF